MFFGLVIPETLEIIFQILGGLGIFLIGIKFMGDGLKLLAGDRLKYFIDKYTTNPIKGMFVGIIVTGAIQSSSGTTALSISLVRAGLMTLPQSIAVIIGANIGTTITSILIGLKISVLALPILAIGAFLIMFANKKKHTHLGLVLFGFGALFYGLEVMGEPLKAISEEPWFTDVMITMSNRPLLALAVGTVFTFLVQSSSAVIGIVQMLYSTGVVPLEAAIPFVLGSNIGTTITAVLASFGGCVAAKRAATAHVIFNLSGAVLFMILLHPYIDFIEWASRTFDIRPTMQIAFSHGVFNIVMAIIMLPLIGYIVKIVTFVWKDDSSEISEEIYLNDQLLSSPSMALSQAKVATSKMGIVVISMLKNAKDYIVDNNTKKKEYVIQSESLLDSMEERIKEYLVEITHVELSDENSELHRTLIQSAKDFERMGDNVKDIVLTFEEIKEKKETLSEGAIEDFNIMYDSVLKIVEKVTSAFTKDTIQSCKKVLEYEKAIDKIEKKARARHLKRVQDKECSGFVSAVFINILSELEKISDQAENIANYMLGHYHDPNDLDYSLLDVITH